MCNTRWLVRLVISNACYRASIVVFDETLHQPIKVCAMNVSFSPTSGLRSRDIKWAKWSTANDPNRV